MYKHLNHGSARILHLVQFPASQAYQSCSISGPQGLFGPSAISHQVSQAPQCCATVVNTVLSRILHPFMHIGYTIPTFQETLYFERQHDHVLWLLKTLSWYKEVGKSGNAHALSALLVKKEKVLSFPMQCGYLNYGWDFQRPALDPKPLTEGVGWGV